TAWKSRIVSSSTADQFGCGALDCAAATTNAKAATAAKSRQNAKGAEPAKLRMNASVAEGAKLLDNWVRAFDARRADESSIRTSIIVDTPRGPALPPAQAQQIETGHTAAWAAPA